jgi:hypothetical protein
MIHLEHFRTECSVYGNSLRLMPVHPTKDFDPFNAVANLLSIVALFADAFTTMCTCGRAWSVCRAILLRLRALRCGGNRGTR